jgi:hypothetical protein
VLVTQRAFEIEVEVLRGSRSGSVDAVMRHIKRMRLLSSTIPGKKGMHIQLGASPRHPFLWVVHSIDSVDVNGKVVPANSLEAHTMHDVDRDVLESVN